MAHASDGIARLDFDCWSESRPIEAGTIAFDQDYISIYRAGDSWAVWGLTRQGPSVQLWRCATGADLGQFPTMHEALAALRMYHFGVCSGSRRLNG